MYYSISKQYAHLKITFYFINPAAAAAKSLSRVRLCATP